MGASGTVRVRARAQFPEDARYVQRPVGVRNGVADAEGPSRPDPRRVLQNDAATETRRDRLPHESDRARTRSDAHTHGIELPGAAIRLDIRVRLSPHASRQADQATGQVASVSFEQ